MAATAGVPVCLLASAPVLHPAHLEGDPALATEVLPGPPSLASIRQPKKIDPKKPVPPPSYLPTFDPGTTYSGLAGGQVVAMTESNGSRRKRPRLEKGFVIKFVGNYNI